MPGDNYVVNYDINVIDNGTQAIGRFVAATQELARATKNFQKINDRINQLNQRLAALSTKKTPTLNINTKQAISNLDKVVGRLRQIETHIARLGGSGVSIPASVAASTGIAPTGTATGATGKGKKAPAPARPKKTVAGAAKTGGRNLRYQALGQTLIDTGGVGAFDFVKGMGIAYGIAGLGTLVSDVVKSATEYDNLIKTTRNILSSHDRGANFNDRFSNMENIIRSVGVATKFTAPEVADASRFLAMAGFDIASINQAIRPITDIAIIGDDDLGKTADVVTNIMTGFGIAPDEVRHAADVMTQTFTMSNTTLMEMAEAYKYAGSLLSRNGTKFEEATAAIGILGDAGIKGSQAGTTLRTMAINLAKPTKAQAEMWDKLGISRTDKQGNLRSMVDIFGDLAEKDLSLGQFAQLFHKTAASGASALAAHVDKWNNVIRENFMSAGLSEQLAEEKKNTIQGLWAQLTSAFTEAGMQAFEEKKGSIQEVLGSAIEWLKSPEAIDVIKRISNSVSELFKALGDVSKKIFELYKRFDGFIMGWMKLQLVLSMVLIPLRVVSSMMNFGKFALNGVMQIGRYAMKFNELGASARAAAAAIRQVNMAASGGVAVAGPSGRMHDPAVWARYKAIQSATKWGQIKNIATPMVMGLGTMLGGAAGAYLGSTIGEDGSAASMTGSIVGGIVGTGLGAAAPSLLSKAGGWIAGAIPSLAGLFSTPVVGWGLAALAAIGGVTAAFVIHAKRVREAAEATKKYLDLAKVENGINMSEKASLTDRYYQILYDGQLNANDALEKYIALRREEMGLDQERENGTKLKDTEAYKNWTKGRLGKQVDDILNFFSPQKSDALLGTGEAVRDYYYHIGHHGLGYDFDKYQVSDYLPILQADKMLISQFGGLLEGAEDTKLRDTYTKALFQANTVEEFDRTLDLLENARIEALKMAIPGSEKWDIYDYGDKTQKETANSYRAIQIAYDSARKAIEDNSALQLWRQVIGGQVELNESTLAKLLYTGPNKGNVLFKSDFGLWDSDEFWGNLGYNKSTDTWSGIPGAPSGPEAKDNAIDLMQHTKEQIDYFGSNWRGVMRGMLEPGWSVIGNQGALPAPIENDEDGGNGGNGGNGGYTNNYKSTSATPKQIIVKIENLMNVESVDLGDPNKAAVVNDLKTQLAQALTDVVNDFSINMGNI